MKSSKRITVLASIYALAAIIGFCVLVSFEESPIWTLLTDMKYRFHLSETGLQNIVTTMFFSSILIAGAIPTILYFRRKSRERPALHHSCSMLACLTIGSLLVSLTPSMVQANETSGNSNHQIITSVVVQRNGESQPACELTAEEKTAVQSLTAQAIQKSASLPEGEYQYSSVGTTGNSENWFVVVLIVAVVVVVAYYGFKYVADCIGRFYQSLRKNVDKKHKEDQDGRSGGNRISSFGASIPLSYTTIDSTSTGDNEASPIFLTFVVPEFGNEFEITAHHTRTTETVSSYLNDNGLGSNVFLPSWSRDGASSDEASVPEITSEADGTITIDFGGSELVRTALWWSPDLTYWELVEGSMRKYPRSTWDTQVIVEMEDGVTPSSASKFYKLAPAP